MFLLVLLLLMDELHKVPHDAMLFLKCFTVFSLLFTRSKLETNGNVVMPARPEIGSEQGGGDRSVNEVILNSLFICSTEIFGFGFLFNFFLKSGMDIQMLPLLGKKPIN